MNLHELMSSLNVSPWVILVLLVVLVAHTVTLLIYLATLQKSSRSSKVLNQASQNCLLTLEQFLTTTMPNLSQALKTVLISKNLLTLQEPKQDPEQTEPEQTEQTEPEQTSMDPSDLVKIFMEVLNNAKKY